MSESETPLTVEEVDSMIGLLNLDTAEERQARTAMAALPPEKVRKMFRALGDVKTNLKNFRESFFKL